MANGEGFRQKSDLKSIEQPSTIMITNIFTSLKLPTDPSGGPREGGGEAGGAAGGGEEGEGGGGASLSQKGQQLSC